MSQMFHLAGPVVTQIVTGELFKLLKRPSGHHSQAESRSLPGPRKRRELLARLEWPVAKLNLFAVQLGIRPVLGSQSAHIAGCTRSQAVKGTASPVIHIMTASVFRQFKQCRKITLVGADFCSPTHCSNLSAAGHLPSVP